MAKVAGSKLIVKQRCPVHGGRQFKVNLTDKDQYIDFIKDGVFRCYKCGEEAKQSFMKVSGPWTLVKTSCPTHGAITTQKIWSTIYNEISSPEDETIKPAQLEPAEPVPSQPELSQEETISSEDNKFCPNCGAPLEGSEHFCGECGSKLN